MPATTGTANEAPSHWAPVLQLIALAEQRFRQIAREEHLLLAAEQIDVAAVADQNDQMLTVQQAAAVLGMKPQTVYEWIKAGKIQSCTAGSRSVRIKRGHVLAALQAHTQPDGRRKYARRSSSTPKAR
ncbi:helix-turn-helix domain-containing protein [Hymenobacter negativus]|uniref:Helix-turn-helix domain-containing protein n=1 Tax=Hymenobacter negativus TaxID=2795026 RepID=A0ABS0Q5I5_9BACT|nr:helix-turn-helix domain-containing protein [Hymenobacter negativus]MBH8557923.1 helix-turn-helix domain-containing protein [Hymenobacter negativus]